MAKSEILLFEWDETKRERNIEFHGIDFITASEMWAGDILETKSPQSHHDEHRFIAIGTITEQTRIITVVFTWRQSGHDEVRRIISARRARKNERESYQKAFGRGT